ncbi:unannotated protein [freshwater metagenome]|uniref:Unannotated protein n=1 Tax=freshwater metagenome TaxID=449393 RepID=A0A6J7BUK6_9ZZZZ|nr:hypothetical protein [Actinomycetota bacterium]MSX49604.1 hypothetical protein [Actinomycetota bacterium]
MAGVKKVAPHQALQNTLQSWAQQYGLQEDPYISGLSNAVANRKNLPMWASLNPLEYLPHAPANVGKGMKRIVLTITIIRNALVFLPVALTWFAISKATSAFAIYTADNTLGVVNFLDFWENGYGVLDKAWSLSHVATLDFQIILLIITLTIAITLLDKQIRDNYAREVSNLDEDRIRLAMSISTYLFDHQRVTQVSMNQSLAKALRDLMNSTESLDKSSKDLGKTVKAIPSNREILNEIKSMKSPSRFDRL